MNLTCTICNDLVGSSEAIYMTKCGHVFHHRCLVQWTNRSQTCPQCRARVTSKDSFRMYPTVASCDADAASLQSSLDHAQLQLREERAKLQTSEHKLAELSAELDKCKELLTKTNKRLVSAESAVLALKSEVAGCRSREAKLKELTEENGQLKKSLTAYESVQRVMAGSTADVDEMLNTYTDIHTVVLFASTLKKALVEAEKKKRESRREMLHAQREATVANEKLRDAERLLNMAKCNSPVTAACEDSPTPAQHKQTTNQPSPYLRLQRGHSAIITSVKPSEQMYLKTNCPMAAGGDAGYDGLGGRSKPDNFPKSRSAMPTITKKHKLKNLDVTTPRKRHK